MAATSTPTADVPVFMGMFRHTMDSKGRLTIPAAWRFAEEVELFLIPNSTAKCLTVMPRAEVNRIRAKADALPGAQRLAVLRHLGAKGHQVTLDKSGRLTVPEEFCRSFKLAGEVTLSGAIETFELWHNADWDAAQPNAEAAAGTLLTDLGL